MPPETSALWPTMLNYGLTILLGIIAWNVKDIVASVKELKLDMSAAKTALVLHDWRIKQIEEGVEAEQ